MRIPISTYRLQLTPRFGLESARSVLPYLEDLGISDLYLSPVTRAVAASEHGYDVAAPNEISDELGGRPSTLRLHEDLRSRGMGWLQDIVPNHMAFHSANAMLMDVLENGPASRFARFFDIEWDHFQESLRGRILAPFLGQFYGEALAAGEIRLAYDADGLAVRYYDLRFPVRIESYVRILTHDLPVLEKALGEQHPDLMRFIATVHSLNSLPGPDRAAERHEFIRIAKTLIRELADTNDAIRDYIARNLAFFNGDPADPASLDMLDRLLAEQHFRLSFWKVATEEINYRRFFTINNLISVRLQDEQVFHDTHALIAELIRDGVIDGLRVDHIDGLLDPTEYLRRLRAVAPEAYIVVEKILEHGERLPDEWPIAGTTGYDFLNALNGVFCRSAGGPAFTRMYARYASVVEPYERLVIEKKRLMLEKHLGGNIDNLAHQLKRISSQDRYGNDITLYGLRRALVAVLSRFPVYRTYIDGSTCRSDDVEYLRSAIARALEHNPDMRYELGYIEKFLLLCTDTDAPEAQRQQSTDFVMHFQQITGPLMAKGVEDTALYVYNRLISLNEVGGSPQVFGVSLDQFHDFNLRTLNRRPHTLNATATHDTKRGEDVRARLNVLSEIPHEWDRMVREWRRVNKRRKVVHGEKAPDKNDEYFLYQALLGSWPFDPSEQADFTERFRAYIVKAVREAKVHTNWLRPDEEYETAVTTFINTILSHKTGALFLKTFLPFQQRLAHYGIFNSLSQLLIKITAPGVPDFYQGTELWDLSMVDPDNRRPVDFSLRQDMLAATRRRAESDRAELIRELLNSMSDGRIKLFVMIEALRARRRWEEVFRLGDYVPIMAEGERADNIIAFMRRRDDHILMTVVPRFLTDLVTEDLMPFGESVWGTTRVIMPESDLGRWHNLFTHQNIRGDGSIRAADIFTRFPVALLVREDEV